MIYFVMVFNRQNIIYFVTIFKRKNVIFCDGF